MLEKLLVFDPSKRLSAEEALGHPYMEALHNVNDEPVAEPFGCAARAAAAENARAREAGGASECQPRAQLPADGFRGGNAGDGLTGSRSASALSATPLRPSAG
jgi:hypothetical protein